MQVPTNNFTNQRNINYNIYFIKKQFNILYILLNLSHKVIITRV
ncbi:hypothetical protein pb186bvf_009515 [Paramecium bursaria]